MSLVLNAERAYRTAVMEFSRTCRCCGSSFVFEIKIGGQYRYCPTCRTSCLALNYSIRLTSPHRQ